MTTARWTIDVADVINRLNTHMETDDWRHQPFHLEGASIAGSLDISGAEIKFPLSFENCEFDEPIVAADADLATLHLAACELAGFVGDNLRTRGDLALWRNCVATGYVSITDACIGGTLHLAFRAATDPIVANQLAVAGSILCHGSLEHELSLIGAKVGGQLECDGTFRDGGVANAYGLNAKQITIAGSLTLSGTADEVSLLGAKIGGQLNLSGATIGGLSADQMEVGGGVFLNNQFTATKEVSLHGVHIGGQLVLDGSTLHHSPGTTCALMADSAVVDGDICCREVRAAGKISVRGLRTNGNFHLGGATIDNDDDVALSAEHLTVLREMRCDDEFTACGTVSLLGAHITENLSFATAKLVPRHAALKG